jgi:hypothetical protein
MAQDATRVTHELAQGTDSRRRAVVGDVDPLAAVSISRSDATAQPDACVSSK